MAKKTEASKVESKGTIAAKKAAATKKANAAAAGVAKATKVVAKATKKVVGAAKASAIKVAAWRFQDSGESGRYVYFRLVGAKGVELSVLNSIQVSLSRVPGGCVFGLDKLQYHDHHAPPFYNGGDGEAGDADQPYHKFGGEKSADAYLERVFTDITAEVAKVLPNVAVEFSKTPWTNKLPKNSDKE
jgi:hypothetical protein